ncbi:MAG: transposase [Candidatus Portnoybacteria bacterium]|nr:transposase [Candidatus Portnoybacteria bacterium]
MRYIGNSSQELKTLVDLQAFTINFVSHHENWVHWLSYPWDSEDVCLRVRFLLDGNFNEDMNVFNKILTEWPIEYNFRRPHQSLAYLTPPIIYSKTYQVVVDVPVKYREFVDAVRRTERDLEVHFFQLLRRSS